MELKTGTVLLNTYAGDKNPLRKTIYLKTYNSKGYDYVECFYVYNNKIQYATFYKSDVGDDKGIKPVGYINIEKILKKIQLEIEKIKDVK